MNEPKEDATPLIDAIELIIKHMIELDDRIRVIHARIDNLESLIKVMLGYVVR